MEWTLVRSPWHRQSTISDEEKKRIQEQQSRKRRAAAVPISKEELQRIAADSKVQPQVIPPSRRADEESK
jgi:hypothetical protein